ASKSNCIPPGKPIMFGPRILSQQANGDAAQLASRGGWLVKRVTSAGKRTPEAQLKGIERHSL
ncbi:MAG: hypothetical protein ACK2T3_15720, partial [Candidatus Promineifilaceae bacterium]